MLHIVQPIANLYNKVFRIRKKVLAGCRRHYRRWSRGHSVRVVFLALSAQTEILQQQYRNIERYRRLGYLVIVVPNSQEKEAEQPHCEWCGMPPKLPALQMITKADV